MNGYMFLDPEQAIQLRRERIRQLEVDHYSTLLLLEEVGRDDRLELNLAEMRKRIDHHVRALTPPAPDHQDDELEELPEDAVPG